MGAVRATGASWKRGGVALLCTYALILHAVLLALASGLAAGPSPLPTHILCAPGGTSAPDAPAKPEHNAPCCTAGCLASATGIPPVAIGIVPLRPVRLAEARLQIPPAPAALPGRFAYPLGARAPPVLT